MSLLVPERLDTPELLDEGGEPAEEVERSLRDLRRINRWLGGLALYRRLLRRFGRVRSVLDVGAGSGDVVGRADVPFRVALDFRIEHLLYARESVSIHRVVGDASSLPFRSSSVDLVTSAHFFHHFSPADNETILRESLRVATQGVAVNDTRRHYVPLLFVRFLGFLRLVGRITRFDAPASVLRGYTPVEAKALALRAGASRVDVGLYWPFRIGILLWK